jgi:hypothetical protein
LVFWCAAAGIYRAAAPVVAQTASDIPSESACPAAPLSIYFASGDVTGSLHTVVLIERIGETAANCQADRIDLVAHIDAKVDGDRAVAVALERLNNVANELVARGLPANRIQVAARASQRDELLAGPNQINVHIRKVTTTPVEAPKSKQSVRLAPIQSI